MTNSTTFQASDLSQTARLSHSAGSNALFAKQKAEEAPIPGRKINDEGDKVTLSGKADALVTLAASHKEQLPEHQPLSEESNSDESKLRDSKQAPFSSDEVLTDEEQHEVEQLKRRDSEVRVHEQAHQSAAGGLSTGSVSFDYDTGPDGKRYAVGGEVNIDTSNVPGDPQATLIKAQKIRRAALAPVDPSAQDRSVAAAASQMEAQARTEISQQGRERQSTSADERSIAKDAAQVNFFAPHIEQNEKNIQDSYKKIQQSSVLEEQPSFVDVFI